MEKILGKVNLSLADYGKNVLILKKAVSRSINRIEKVVNLGHKKKDKSMMRQINHFMDGKDGAIQAKGGHRDNIAAYRFYSSENISNGTLRRQREKFMFNSPPENEKKQYILAHDITYLNYKSHLSKEDRKEINHDGQSFKGYEYLTGLVVDPEKESSVGVLYDTLINKYGPDDTNEFDYENHQFYKSSQKDLNVNHNYQVGVHIRELNIRHELISFIHVMDREFDDSFLMQLCSENSSYVIRRRNQRNLLMEKKNYMKVFEETKGRALSGEVPDGWTFYKTKDIVERLPLTFYKELPLDKENRLITDKTTTPFRIAKTYIGSVSFRLPSRARRDHKYYPIEEPSTVNLVVIKERDTPQGVEPLCWILYTNLPVESEEDLRFVGRCYELRWLIEDYYRVLKECFEVEKCRLDRGERIARLLIILSYVAIIIFHLRRLFHLGRGGRIPYEVYVKLKQAHKEMFGKHTSEKVILLTKYHLLAVIVRWGGWGWGPSRSLGNKVLARGIMGLFDASKKITDFVRYP